MIACTLSLCGLYFFRTTYTKIPLVRGPGKTLFAQVQLQGKEYFFLLDSGTAFELIIQQNLLDQLKKTQGKEIVKTTLQGLLSKSLAYRLDRLIIGKHHFKSVKAVSVTSQEVHDFFFTAKPKQHLDNMMLGIIGRGLLGRMNLLIDVPKRVMIEVNTKNALRQAGYDLKHWTSIPFTQGSFGPQFKIHTDFGMLQFALHTTMTYSEIKGRPLEPDAVPSQVTSEHFIVGETNFGSQALCLSSLKEDSIDGFLGLDFIETHPIYIDHQEQMLYIGFP